MRRVPGSKQVDLCLELIVPVAFYHRVRQLSGKETVLKDGGIVNQDGTVSMPDTTVGGTGVYAPEDGNVTVNSDGSVTVLFDFKDSASCVLLEGETEFSHIPDWYSWERRCVREEIETARTMLELMNKDASIGFEAPNHYYFSKGQLAEKIINCRYLLDIL